MAEKAGYAQMSHEVLRQQIVQRCGYLGAVAQVPYLGGVYYSTDVFETSGIQKVPQTWALTVWVRHLVFTVLQP